MHLVITAFYRYSVMQNKIQVSMAHQVTYYVYNRIRTHARIINSCVSRRYIKLSHDRGHDNQRKIDLSGILF